MVSRSRLRDDGYNDGKSGRVPLDRQLFESPVDYQIYIDGYNQAKSETEKKAKPSLFPDIWPSGICVGSGVTIYDDTLYELGSRHRYRKF